MPISYYIDADRNLIVTEADGILTNDDLYEHRRKILRDPAFRPGMRELADTLSVERHEMSIEGIQRLVELQNANETLMGEYRLAIVTDSELAFGMARVYQALTIESLTQVRVFKDIQEADAWLFNEEDEQAAGS